MLRRLALSVTGAVVAVVLSASAASAGYTVSYDHLTLNQALVACGNLERASGYHATLHAFVDSIGRSHKHCVVSDYRVRR